MKRNKLKHRLLRDFVKSKKIKDGYLKSAMYGSMFDHPKKVLKAIQQAKNINHKNYIINMCMNLAKKGKSNNCILLLEEELKKV